MKNRLPGYRTIGKGTATVLAMLALILTLSSMTAAAAPSGSGKQSATAPALTQYFEDVPVGSFYYAATAALYTNGVISGYTCGNPPAGPCVPPNNLPYYLASNTVTRGQMSFYVQNVRTHPGINIDVSNVPYTGTTPIQVYMTGTASIALYAEQKGSGTQDNYGSGAQGIVGWGSGNYTQGVFGYGSGSSHSYGVFGYSVNSAGGYFTSTNGDGLVAYSTANDAGYFNSDSGYGGYFTSASNDAADFYGNEWGIYTVNSGTNPAGTFYALGTGEGVYATVPTNTLGTDALYGSDGASGGSGYAMYAAGDGRVTGTFYNPLSAGGATAGIMKNAGKATLERGDVVVIAGDSSETIMGSVPAVNIALASKAGDSAVVGIVDSPVYVPDAATDAAYQAQDNADNAAGQAAAQDPSKKAAFAASLLAPGRISKVVGRLHSMAGTTVAAGGYANVITLGQYQAVKVDASFGAIHAGDLLTSSPHAGYAMKADAKAIASGAIIGKALGSMDRNSGLIPVMVTLK